MDKTHLATKASIQHHPKVESLKAKWPDMTLAAKKKAFLKLTRVEAEELFMELSTAAQAEIFANLERAEQRSWVRLLAPDDAADLLQEFPTDERPAFLELLDDDTKKDVMALLAYAEDAAGGLMNPRFVRLRPDITVDVAIRYLRAQATSSVETIYYAYVLDAGQKLLGVVTFRNLFVANPEKLVSEIMRTDVITVLEHLQQEEVGRKFSEHKLMVLPVIDEEGVMKGIVTMDDVVDVVQEEATEDIQKLGGMEALTAPYFQTTLFEMIKKRAGWLMILFVGEMFTATAMSHYEKEIEKAVVLALFIPLIISSGGNSGSQASTLMIRAMALGHVRLKDWLRVFVREISTGLALGVILGGIGLLRILLWPSRMTVYGEHFVLVALTVAGSLLGIVLWGTLSGSMLPFLLRRVGFDPASASAPFVATLVDVTGIIIYFSVASLILGGTLL